MKPKLIFRALACGLALTNTTALFAQEAATDTKAQEAELAKKLQNPVAALISVPIQNNWDFGIGPADAMKYTANIQPVVPLSISKDWNLIIRTIMPVIYAEAVSNDPLAPASVRESHAGLGDITQSFFLSPKEPVGGWILGSGRSRCGPRQPTARWCRPMGGRATTWRCRRREWSPRHPIGRHPARCRYRGPQRDRPEPRIQPPTGSFVTEGPCDVTQAGIFPDAGPRMIVGHRLGMNDRGGSG